MNKSRLACERLRARRVAPPIPGCARRSCRLRSLVRRALGVARSPRTASALTVTRSACMRCSLQDHRRARLKRAGADVQRHERRVHAHLATAREHRLHRNANRPSARRLRRARARRQFDSESRRPLRPLRSMYGGNGIEPCCSKYCSGSVLNSSSNRSSWRRDVVSFHTARQRDRHFGAQRLARMRVRENATPVEHALEQDLDLPAGRLDCRCTRAGITRVSLNTSRSPARSSAADP